jgi:hypothetical protein
LEGKQVKTEEIPAYCAVALAGLGWLPDTIMSRAAIIRMRRRKPGETIEPFRRRMELEAGHKLKGRLARWARDVEPIVTWPEMPAGVEDRDADVWEALIAVADAAGGDWPERARKAAKALVGEAKDREPSLGIRLLADLKTVFGDVEQMTTEAILRALHGMAEAPWNDLKGKPLNSSDSTGEDVADADETKRNTPHTSATRAADVADKRSKNGNKNSGVADVADVALVPEAEGDDSLDIPACLDRRGEVCAHCGQPGGSQWDNPPVRLHFECERPWIDAYEASHNPRSRVVVGSSR